MSPQKCELTGPPIFAVGMPADTPCKSLELRCRCIPSAWSPGQSRKQCFCVFARYFEIDFSVLDCCQGRPSTMRSGGRHLLFRRPSNPQPSPRPPLPATRLTDTCQQLRSRHGSSPRWRAETDHESTADVSWIVLPTRQQQEQQQQQQLLRVLLTAAANSVSMRRSRNTGRSGEPQHVLSSIRIFPFWRCAQV